MALPVVTYLYGQPSLTPDRWFYDSLFLGQFGSASEGKLPLVTSFGAKIVFTGDFTTDHAGAVTGGTMTGYKVFAGHTKVATGAGYDIPAIELIAAVEAYQAFDYAALDELLISAPANYVGSELGDYISSTGGEGSVLRGRNGADNLFTTSPDTTLKGGKGQDLLVALDGGSDYFGGPGKDAFGFITPDLPNRIHDFNPAADMISLNIVQFPGVGEGLLDDAQFKIGRHASTPEQIVIYQRGKGVLWFDQDGSDDTYAAVKIARLDKGLNIAASNFFGDDYGPV
jgi:Ca2+-binding RTX toxin-like protein